MKHTETPWESEPGDGDNEAYLVTGPGGCLIAVVNDEGQPQDNEANAAFIVKACNLHEELVEAAEAAIESMDEFTIDAQSVGMAAQKLRAVLKKAGE